MIEVEHLRKEFRGVAAVRDLSFRAPDGAITGLLGSNGAGKTTTLRMISGALQPHGGQIRIDGLSLSQNPLQAQQRLGALLDHMGLYPRLTTRENLAYFGRMRGIPDTRLRHRIDEVLDILGLGALADRRTTGFSQGERMKVALGRAIIHSPRNLLLDEPTNGLDVPTVRGLRGLLQRMRDEGICVIFSSHVLEEVRALCDNVVVIAQGTVAAQGTADELCLRTRSSNLEEAFVQLTVPKEAIAC
ncbi:MAG TPA: ATP-binding cassette domain-containing protein [Bryobacteraceae bacterium]|nr:ATP-binding cassette domain-containing protein [Bryobacteraceae bacterium]